MRDETFYRPLGDDPPKARLIYGVDVREGLRMLPDASVQMVATSPPYWGLRDYDGVEGQIGMEDTPEEFVEQMIEVFREVRRVLRDDGVLWLNLGDTYNSGSGGYCPTDKVPKFEQMSRIGEGSKQSWRKKEALRNHPGLKRKDLAGIPWETALALRRDGWYLRSDIIWSKGTCMPEPVRDRLSKSHEYVFMLTKSERYFFDQEAVRVWDTPQGRNKRTVWSVNPKPYAGAHFATWPEELVEPMVKAGSSEGGCCSECGAPRTRLLEYGKSQWQRIQEEQGIDWKFLQSEAFNRGVGLSAGRSTTGGLRNANGTVPSMQARLSVMKGWGPTCDCVADTSRCTVLDPFSGSATTGAVALRMGRSYIGMDLNETYLDLAVARLEGRKPPVAQEKDPDSTLSLFE